MLCHGDMHPFNVLVTDDGALTVLDWSAAMLAPATYDLGFTSLLLAEPPLVVPGLLRPIVRRAGAPCRRFVRGTSPPRVYESTATLGVAPGADLPACPRRGGWLGQRRGDRRTWWPSLGHRWRRVRGPDSLS